MNPSKLLDSQVDVDVFYAKYDYIIYMFLIDTCFVICLSATKAPWTSIPEVEALCHEVHRQSPIQSSWGLVWWSNVGNL